MNKKTPTARFFMTLPKPMYDRLSERARIRGVSIQNRIRAILEDERMGSLVPQECPECHYGGYKYYVEHNPTKTMIDPRTNEEVPFYSHREEPVVVKTMFGWLCRLCRYEWREDGTPVAQEDIDQFIIDIRKYGKEHHAKIQSSIGKK